MRYPSDDDLRKNGLLTPVELWRSSHYRWVIISGGLFIILLFIFIGYRLRERGRRLTDFDQSRFGSTTANDCQISTYGYRGRQCSIIVDERKLNGSFLILKGRNSQTDQKEIYGDVGTWYPTFYKRIELGDTVIKHKDEMIFYIHKKNTVLTIPYECEGKVYP